MKKSIITSENTYEDEAIEKSLRPRSLSEYIGQNKVKKNLQVFIEAAKKRKESLDHVLLYGPPGLGKTTLAGIVAEEMGVSIKITSGPAIEKPGELAAILSQLSENDVLFIDEIHRLNKQVEEVLYPAMEDFAIDIVIGKGEQSKSIRLDLPKFTLIGATTRAGMLSAPLRDRFGVVNRLEFYNVGDLMTIIIRSAGVLGVTIDDEGALEVAKRSRGTPRLANRLLKRVRDFAEVEHEGKIDYNVAKSALDQLDVDSFGLDDTDRDILLTIIKNYGGGPVGLEVLAAAIGEDSGTIEDVYEPYLIKNGLINRTPRGRVVTEKAYKKLNMEYMHKKKKKEVNYQMGQVRTDIPVVINNKVYTLSGFEGEEYLQNIATYINGKIAECKTSEEYRRMNIEYQGVLLALNIADDYFKAKSKADETATDNSDKEQQLYELRHEVIESQIKHEAALKLVEEYKEQVNILQKRLVQLEAERDKK